MRISIFGLGYVGSVSSACFAELGHHVIAVDKNEAKVSQIASGRSPIVELGVSERLERAAAFGNLEATTDSLRAVAETDVSIISVGTPSLANGDVYLGDISAACGEVGEGLAQKDAYHLVIVTSTVPPGTVGSALVPILERTSGKAVGADFGVCMVPEFLREGTAVEDFLHPPKTVIGACDDRAAEVAGRLYRDVAPDVIVSTIALAEMVKFTDNAWHALKVSFANEIGRVADAYDVDSQEVMQVFVRDTKLNISPAYLRPGFSFGGSCLPKDVRTLTFRARTAGVTVPVLDSILASNASHFEDALSTIVALGPQPIGLLGLSFKAGTDDLRESPVVELAERLLGKGYDLKIYDRNVSIGRLVGANRDYILSTIPHISELLTDSIDEVLDHARLLVVGNNDPEFNRVSEVLRPGQRVFDLVGIQRDYFPAGTYSGITW